MSKRILLVLGFLIGFTTQIAAQQGGGAPQGGQNTSERPKFSSRNLAGIFYYDIDDTVDYLKIKDEIVDRAMAKVIKAHNKEVKKIAFLNTENFNDIDMLMNLARSGSVKPGEKPKEAEGKEHLRKVIPEVRKKLREKEVNLNETVKEIVSAKQYKNWLKYQKKKKKELLPKRPEAPSAIDSKTRGSSFGNGNQLGQQRTGF